VTVTDEFSLAASMAVSTSEKRHYVNYRSALLTALSFGVAVRR
jgi:hypothetical protein